MKLTEESMYALTDALTKGDECPESIEALMIFKVGRSAIVRNIRVTTSVKQLKQFAAKTSISLSSGIITILERV